MTSCVVPAAHLVRVPCGAASAPARDLHLHLRHSSSFTSRRDNTQTTRAPHQTTSSPPMSIVRRQCVCRAHNAFSVSRALNALLATTHPRGGGVRSASTSAIVKGSDKPAAEQHGGESRVNQRNPVSSSTKPTPDVLYHTNNSNGNAVRSDREKGKAIEAERVTSKQPKAAWEQQLKDRVPQPKEWKHDLKDKLLQKQELSSNARTGAPWITDSNPQAVDYNDGKSWHVFSDCDITERRRRLQVLIQWTDCAVEQDARDEPGPPRSEQSTIRSSTDGTASFAVELAAVNEEGLEYTGQVVNPRSVGHVQPGERHQVSFPSVDSGITLQQGFSGEILSNEIRAFAAGMQLTDPERKARSLAENEVRTAVQRITPDHELEVFGSERSGLSIATSDLDFRLMPASDQLDAGTDTTKAPPYHVRRELESTLCKLHLKLCRDRRFRLVLHRHARYPLISMQHGDTGIDIQIVTSNATAYQRSFVAKYLQEYPALKDVYISIKTMFDLRGLCDVFRGGVSSYGIFMMIVAAVKVQQSRNGIIKCDDPGNLLQHFLQFWAEHDTYKYGIKVEPADLFEKTAAGPIAIPTHEPTLNGLTPDETPCDETSADEVTSTSSVQMPTIRRVLSNVRPPGMQRKGYVVGAVDPVEPYLLSLIDPADPSNDLGRKIYGIKHILATLRHFQQEMIANIWNIDAPPSDQEYITSVEGWKELVGHHVDISVTKRQQRPLLLTAIGASDAVYRQRRELMEAAGRKAVLKPTPSTG